MAPPSPSRSGPTRSRARSPSLPSSPSTTPATSSCSSPTPPPAAAASSTQSRSQRHGLLPSSPGSHGDGAAYAPPMKSGKLGFEGTQEVQHRIRITLSSKSIKNLEKVGSWIPSFPPQDPLLAATVSPPLRQQRLRFDAHPKTHRAAAKRTWVGEIGANDYAYNFMAADSIPPVRIRTMVVDRVTTFLELPISSYGGTRRSLAGCSRPPRPCSCCLRSWSTIS